jgi:hypothetical protein
VYVQNASAVGGTALASYPLVSVRVGLARRLQLAVDLPSEVAESRPGGGGAFPTTHTGYGAVYTIENSTTSSTAIVVEALPPNSLYAPSNAQPRYEIGVTSNVVLAPRWLLGLDAAGTSSPTAGFSRILPSVDFSTSYRASSSTQIVTGFGSRLVSRREVAQQAGNLGIDQVLTKKLVFTVGVGTKFNAVNNAKAHYLASGFTYRP